MLSINKVCKTFGQLEILRDITINVPNGIILGLAGPSGSGKSTLLRCIQKLESIDSGAIDFQGSSSFMFQDFQLFPHMTVLENLTYAPHIVLKDYNCEQSAMKLLCKLGLKDKAYVYPESLSGGQKQRVALARSLMMKPHLLLCDEPTSGLDVATIEDVVVLLQSIHTKKMIMIIASHDLDFLIKIADRILLLKAGMIISDIIPSQTTDPIELLKTHYI